MDDKEDSPNIDISIDCQDIFDSYTIDYPYDNLTIGSANCLPNSFSGKLTVEGPDADIDINGISLKTAITEIQQRLNILQPNTKLEAEWDQLRELGEQYRKLEANIVEKQKIWNNLKQ